MWRLSSYPLQALIRLKGGRYIWQVVKTLAVKKLTLRNKLKNSSILSTGVFKKAKVVLAQYLYQEKIFEGGRWPIIRYVVWLLVPLQGQKEAVTERGLDFLIINSPTTWRRILSTSVRT